MHSVLSYCMENREETGYVDSERETRIEKIPIPCIWVITWSLQPTKQVLLERMAECWCFDRI